MSAWEEANHGGQNKIRDVDDVESNHSKNIDASSGKKAARASNDSDTEYRSMGTRNNFIVK